MTERRENVKELRAFAWCNLHVTWEGVRPLTVTD